MLLFIEINADSLSIQIVDAVSLNEFLEVRCLVDILLDTSSHQAEKLKCTSDWNSLIHKVRFPDAHEHFDLQIRLDAAWTADTAYSLSS